MFELKSNVEDTCQNWCKPASKTESQKCENALRMIKDAIRESDELKEMNIQIVPKGSYHNNTNVRLNSDVDIAVVLKILSSLIILRVRIRVILEILLVPINLAIIAMQLKGLYIKNLDLKM